MSTHEDCDVKTVPVAPPPLDNESSSTSKEQLSLSDSALNMVWSFGMNKTVPVINLTDESCSKIAYSCAHTAIIYDYNLNKQSLLQGHQNNISCICASENKRWLATADQGPNNMIIIWDTQACIPVRTIFDPYPDDGICAMAMTPDAKYIATLSYGENQIFAIWDWTKESDSPISTAELPSHLGLQNYIYFNPDDISQIVTNSDSRVVFYAWDLQSLEYFTPPLTDEDFNKAVGKFSQSVFLRYTSRALTATSNGNLVVWDTNKPLTKVVNTEATPDKKALKLVKLQERGINVLTTTDDFVVLGDTLGHVKFLDQSLKLANWYQDFNIGPINSLSFKYDFEFNYKTHSGSSYPHDATIHGRKFVVRDFVIGTTNAVYGHVHSDMSTVSVIQRDHDSSVNALSAHPNRNWLAVGSYSGILKIWDYEKKTTVNSRYFEKGFTIQCCSYNSDGKYIAVGFLNGSIHILDGTSLKDVQDPFKYSHDVISHIKFSHDNQFLAAADAEFTMTLFKIGGEKLYEYVGRHRSHYKTIVDIMFDVQLDSDKPRLISLGSDRVLVEYDLEAPTGLQISSQERIEQSAVPSCITSYPLLNKESYLLTANDQYKFKLYNSTTKMCRRTLLGPTYGSPIHQIIILPTCSTNNTQDNAEETSNSQSRYLAYITDDKVGLHCLPLDGNPHNSMALIAHPDGISNLACSFDGKYLFTAGGTDASTHVWQINYNALDIQAKLGGEDLIPFYGLLDGGRGGYLFRELEDFFYYAQVKSQGVDTMETRQVHTTIPVTEIPFVMRALGFYPSEQEILDMMNEVKYSKYVETSEFVENIDLGDFIKLYINHRPAFGLSPNKIESAFKILGSQMKNYSPSIHQADLLDLLQTKGENMTEFEVAEYLATLFGLQISEDDIACSESIFHGTDEDFDTSAELIEKHLDTNITAQNFTNNVLGFSFYEGDCEGKVSDFDRFKSTSEVLSATE